MTTADAATDPSSLVPGAHRLIRVVDGAEGPFAGTLVGYDGGVAVSVDAKTLTAWAGWEFSGAEHVCGVIDVKRRADGHDALLPWCTQRVETFLGRRLAAEIPLVAGEIGTLVASLLRGVRELGDEPAEADAEWWLTGDGRPLLVHGSGGMVRPRTAALIEKIVAHTSDRATIRILDEIVAALRERRHHGDDDTRWEEALFAVAAPRALRLDVFAPEKAADIAPRQVWRTTPEDTRRARRVRTVTSEHGARETGIRTALRAARAMVRERVSPVLARVGRGDEARRERVGKGTASRVDRTPRTRKRALILAGAAAATVLAAGLMWPEDASQEPANAAPPVDVLSDETSSDDETAAEDEAVEEAPSAEPAPEDTATDPPPAEAAEDALSAVPGLLDAVSECVQQGSASCVDALAEGVGVPAADRLIAHGSDASTVSLIDDYGDVAVVRLTPSAANAESAEQMLVLERRDEKWLVRDVYDVAHQPE